MTHMPLSKAAGVAPARPSAVRLTDPAFLADPGPTLARLRAAGPLYDAKVPLIGRVRLTTSDAGARALLKDPRFVRDPRAVTGRTMAQTLWFLPRFLSPMLDSLILKDGADHRRLRTLVELAFARATIDDMVPQIEAVADGLLDRLDPAAPVDIVRAYARPLPLHAISILLGVPPADRDRIAGWMAPLTSINAVTFFRAMPGMWRTIRHFRRDIRRGAEADTVMIRHLVAAEEDGARLTEDEILSLVVLLFMAGHETTVHMIADATWSLAKEPSLRAGLFGDEAHLKVAVEEFFRFHSPVMMTKMLTATEDLDFLGASVRKGERLSAFLLAANHDPDRWEVPDTLNPDRLPNPHLGFGFGPHVCLGMQLARAEVRVALRRLFTRFPNLALADPARPPTYGRRFGIRSIPRLDLRLSP
ncbi:cytochrome P450 [Wenxinia marina]|uniref:Cytochrome P450 n=1 Tax=Wenxinia marina DSM 24838 TaxID=1123501 RepID=A0A0D0Q1X8_9RHOB|nr:cytochrome P450 [Wenxinia marina]KIQ68559.1 Cytochrome P450 [Wenxinia marina DSM 24838]GGL66877.1 cytochrome P450 [Wenxinia marina]